MASPFSKYQGGIQPIPGLYEMMSQPGKILAEGAVSGVKNYMQNVKESEAAEKEAASAAAASAEKYKDRQLKGVGMAMDAQLKMSEMNQKSLGEQLKLLDPQIETAQFILSTMTSGKGAKPENDPYRLKAQSNIDELIAKRSALSGKVSAEIENARNVVEHQLRLSNEISGIQTQKDDREAADYYTKNPGRTQANQNNAGPYRGAYNIPTETLQAGYDNLPTAPSQFGAPSGTRPGYEQKTYDTKAEETAALVAPGSPYNAFANSKVLQPVGNQTPILSSKYPGANVGELRDMNANSRIGKVERTVADDGKVSYSTGLNINAPEDASTEGVVKFVASMNKTSGSNAAELAQTLTPEGIQKADEFFLSHKDTGLFPKEFSLTQARAAYAVQAFEDGDVASITGDERLRGVLAKNATNGPSLSNRDAATNARVQNTSTPGNAGIVVRTATPADTYKPARMTPMPDYEEIPGIFPGSPNMVRMTTAMANNAVARNDLLKTVYEQQVAAEAAANKKERDAVDLANAIASGKVAEYKVGREVDDYVNLQSAARPGLDARNRIPGLGYASVDLGPGSDETFNAAVKKSQRDRGSDPDKERPNNLDLSKGYSAVAGWGVDPQEAVKNRQGMAETWKNFQLGWSSSTSIMREFEIQNTQGAWANVKDRIFSARTAVAANYRLFLIGAFRKSTVGLGNPSNFEQGLLLGLIPDPKEWFQFTDNSLARSRMLTIYQAHLMHKDMVMHNFKMTPQTEADLTQKFRAAGVIGPKQFVTKEGIEKLGELLADVNAAPEDQLRSMRIWARDYNMDGGTGSTAAKDFDKLFGSLDGKTKSSLNGDLFVHGSSGKNKALANLNDQLGKEETGDWKNQINPVYLR